MKKPTKNLKNRLVKNVAVLSLAGILLCGQGLTAAAAGGTAGGSHSRKAAHVCAFSAVKSAEKSSVKTGSHMYLAYIILDANGNTKEVQKVCHIYQKTYSSIWKCAVCGKTNGTAPDLVETVHSSCGQ